VHGIRYAVEGPLALVTIDRPEVLNALTPDGYAALHAALDRFDADDGRRVAIVTGAGGRAFSVGSDLRVSAARAAGAPGPDGSGDGDGGHDGHDGDGHRGVPMIVSEGAPPPRRRKPVIAAIDGYCVGGGLEWALQADIRVATPRSSFGLPEPRTGSVAGFGLHVLCRLIPPTEALYLQLTGTRIDAERAHRCCLVQELVEPERLLDRCRELAGEIIRCSPAAVAAIKATVDRQIRRDLDDSYAAARPALDALAAGADAREGPRAFVEKRDPRWTGR
jgi:enoyl-CoA hydratase/carnithine racemase